MIDLTVLEQDKSGPNIAVIGTGYWGINYVRVLRDLPEVNRVIAVDARVNRLKEVHEKFKDVELSDSASEIFADPMIDAVVVATPASTHYELVSEALASGKSVLVEKPITTDADEARQLIQLAERQRQTLAVGHTFLYNGAVNKVKTLIQDGIVGNIYYLYSKRTNLGPIRHDVNALWDLATHDISIMNFLLDQTPQWVSAVGSNVLRSGLADVGFIVLGYADDVVANVHVSWADPMKVRELVVVGSQSRIVFDDLRAGEQVRIYEKGVTSVQEPDGEAFGVDLRYRDGDIISPNVAPSEPLKNQCINFIQSFQSGTTPISDGNTGLNVVSTMRAIEESVQRRGTPVELAEVLDLSTS